METIISLIKHNQKNVIIGNENHVAVLFQTNSDMFKNVFDFKKNLPCDDLPDKEMIESTREGFQN